MFYTDRQTKLSIVFSKILTKHLKNARARHDCCAVLVFPFPYQNSCSVCRATDCRKFLCSVDKQLTLSTSLAGTFLPISCSTTSRRLPYSPLHHLVCCSMYGTFLTHPFTFLTPCHRAISEFCASTPGRSGVLYSGF